MKRKTAPPSEGASEEGADACALFIGKQLNIYGAFAALHLMTMLYWLLGLIFCFCVSLSSPSLPVEASLRCSLLFDCICFVAEHLLGESF